MNEIEIVNSLIDYLLLEMPQYVSYSKRYANDLNGRKRLLRSLMNLRPAKEGSNNFLNYQDLYLKNELKNFGIVDCFSIPLTAYTKIALWRGDIVRVKCDAIVNACNSDMLGCFVPNHNCLDNEIHTYAGVQLRLACKNELAKFKGSKRAVGDVFITVAYNLPSKYVIHVLGPSTRGRISNYEKNELKKCYLNILNLARTHNLKTLCIPCISTGEQGFPKKDAALIATETVKDFIMEHPDSPAVIFDTYTDVDEKIYSDLLLENN